MGKLFPAALRVGIRSSNGVIVLSGKPAKLVHPASVYLKSVLAPPFWTATNSDPNDRVLTFLPPINERFAISMTDATGLPVPKTAEGRSLGQTPSLARSVRSFRWDKYGCQCVVLLPQEDYELYPIDPTKYFMIENTGLYKLTLIQRLYLVDSNSCLKAINLPVVSIDVNVEYNTSQ